MQTRELRIIDATPERVAPFGHLVGVPADGTAGRATNFYGQAVELWHVPGFVTDDDACLSIARVRPRAPQVIWMERHFKHTQAFLPLGSAPFVVVMAPPNDQQVPVLDQVQAWRIPPGQGLKMHVGTWHEFPFVEQGALDLVVILRNETNRNLEVVAGGEAVGGDLEKRNLETRLGVRFVLTG